MRIKPFVKVVIGGGLVLYLALRLLPYPELGAFQERAYSLVLNDRNGRTLRVFPAPDGVRREWADVRDVPEAALRVFVRAEDRRFYLHGGVDPLAIIGSAIRNARAGRTVSGASTITMQLARLIRPHRSGLRGKLLEALDALRLESRLSKRAILELWLNNIPFGSNIEGLPAFTRARFGIPVTRLDANHAAVLALVPRRPGHYDPATNPEAALSAALAGKRGRDDGEIEKAIREASVDTPDKAPFFAPHFTERVAAMVAGEDRPRTPLQTTLDLALQLYTEERLHAELAQLERNRVSNGAVLVIENATGAVLAYVGSASWFDDTISGKIDGVMVKNQPGSCLKPFLYALALDDGFDPNTILPDLPSVFGSSEAYIPANFNRRFNGPVRLRVALASSLNIPAVYTLEHVGVSRFEDTLISLGFASIAENRGRYGTGLALGNGEVRLEELVRAFSVFERGGMTLDLRYVSNAAATTGKRCLSPYAAFIIRDILSDKASRFVGFGPAPLLATPFSAMFKTGTANQYQHIWALGASRRWTVGVWMGNFSGETVVGKTGSSIPARIASAVLTALEGEGGGEVDEGEGESVSICALSGLAATPFCSGTLTEWLRRDKIPAPCSWHSAEGAARYPSEYRSWLAERFRSGSVTRGNATIRLPRSGAIFYRDTSLPPGAQALRIETAGFNDNALIYVDKALQGGLNAAGVFVLPLSLGQHTVLVEDDESNASVSFEVR
jgi:penicillin-binding protein 1C